MLKKYIAIAIGGVLGATVRWAVMEQFPYGGSRWWTAYTPLSGGVYSSSDDSLIHLPDAMYFHWAIFLVNLVACLFLGLLLGEERRTKRYRTALQDFGAIGFCGGLSTMSTFAVDVAVLMRAHFWGDAVTYFVSNVVVGIFAVFIGAWLARRTSALTLPVEEQP